MRITEQEFLRYFARPKKLNLSTVLNRIHRHYCQPMTSAGKCTTICDNCKSNIAHSLQDICKSHIHSPYGLLVRELRTRVAEEVEREEREPLQTGWTGEVRSENPFEIMLEEL